MAYFHMVLYVLASCCTDSHIKSTFLLRTLTVSIAYSRAKREFCLSISVIRLTASNMIVLIEFVIFLYILIPCRKNVQYIIIFNITCCLFSYV